MFSGRRQWPQGADTAPGSCQVVQVEVSFPRLSRRGLSCWRIIVIRLFCSGGWGWLRVFCGYNWHERISFHSTYATGREYRNTETLH